MSGIPRQIAGAFAHARRLEWWTLFWIGSVVVVMFFATGSSQAMRTAWIEDILSLVPAIVFLIAARLETCGPTKAFPFGFHRVQSLAFLISAVALSAVGLFLLFESAMTLIRQEHVTIPPVTLFGQTIWMGWLMIAALAYSIIPPVILGHLKEPVAKQLQDKVLHTDALMQKADWMTGLAGIGGILGVGLGFWWADALASGVISASILRDGIGALRSSTAELIDGAPRKLDSNEISDEVEQLRVALQQGFPGAEVRTRETGRYIHAQICGIELMSDIDLAALWPGKPERSWRLAQVSFVPRQQVEEL